MVFLSRFETTTSSLNVMLCVTKHDLTSSTPDQHTCHAISLSCTRQVVLLTMMGLSEFEEILQPQELTDSLPDGATSHQSVPSIIHQ